ncbi:Plasmid encoded RepA protein (plasmid) [Rickettsiales bacterium Ac37b]|nr:Plasmid encoded RepA protein [Rickettsiales bacterium Ac37b]
MIRLTKDYTHKKSLTVQEEPQDIGYIARALVSASLPHSKPKGLVYKRQCNNFTLSIIGNDEAGGIPYGSYPRIILSWLSTEVFKNKSREIILGKSLSNFMKNLGISVSGGKWGTLSRFKDQMCRLFASTITCTYHDASNGKFISTKISIADKTRVFWNPENFDNIDVFNSKILLGEEFYNEILSNPVPIDIEAVQILKDSSLALDIYFWLTYRMSYLKKPILLNFETLQSQFGAGYTTSRHHKYEFKRKFILQLEKVLEVYNEANVNILDSGILLSPSNTHIRMSDSIKDKNQTIIEQDDLYHSLKNDFSLPEKQILNLLDTYEKSIIRNAIEHTVERLNYNNTKINNITAYLISAIKNSLSPSTHTLEHNENNKQDIDLFLQSIDNDHEKQVLLVLLKQYDIPIFKSWFMKMRVDTITEREVVYVCKTDFIKEYLLDHYKEDILYAWKQVCPSLENCIFHSIRNYASRLEEESICINS